MTATEHAIELVQTAARAASDKLAQQIVAFDVSDQLAITDAFLLASATNDRQVKAIVDEAGPSVAKGRTMADAPDIDGTIHIAAHRRLRPGDIVDVRVEAADAYDLRGRAA